MRASTTRNGLTVRVIAGTHCAIIAIDLQENKRKGCLGFTIYRDQLDAQGKEDGDPRALPSMLRFPSDTSDGRVTTETAPLQKFRWGDYTVRPGTNYRYTVVARYGQPLKLDPVEESPTVSVDITTEDPGHRETAVFFNRAAAASEAFNREFPDVDDVNADTDEARRARAWLSNGLEEAIIAFLGQAQQGDALHCAIYEFQKPELLQGLKDAIGRGVDVKVVYHARRKNEKDKTVVKNEAAIKAAGLQDVVSPRKENPQTAIMHDKFVVWLQKQDDGKQKPVAAWTGSTNWTEGGIYGQLNVGHAVYEDDVAEAYETLFQLLAKDPDASEHKQDLAALTPVSLILPGEHRVIPIFSPQNADTMLHLYAGIAENAKMLLVSAPFALSPIILAVIAKKRDDILRFLLLDKVGSLGKGEEVHLIQGDPADSIAVATTVSSPLHDFQGKLLEGKESFHHAGIHIHSKVILVDPFGSDPIVITGSANFSKNSTEENDSNSLVIRGYTGVADIYATEFMRMFEHYHFRAKHAAAKGKGADKPLGLHEDDSWSDKYFVSGSTEEKDRRMFAGTM